MPTTATTRRRTFAVASPAVIAAAITLLMVGCTSRPVLIGPKPAAPYEIVGPSEGGGCGLLFQGLIPFGVNSRTQRAYEQAIRGKGLGLIDTEIQYSWWWIPYIGTVHCTTIMGTVIR